MKILQTVGLNEPMCFQDFICGELFHGNVEEIWVLYLFIHHLITSTEERNTDLSLIHSSFNYLYRREKRPRSPWCGISTTNPRWSCWWSSATWASELFGAAPPPRPLWGRRPLRRATDCGGASTRRSAFRHRFDFPWFTKVEDINFRKIFCNI